MPEETQSGIKRFPKTGSKVVKGIKGKAQKQGGAVASLAAQSPGFTIKAEKKIASVTKPVSKPSASSFRKKQFGISNLKRGGISG